MPREQSGWRTRTTIAEDTHVPNVSFYGKGGRFGPVLKELMSSGLIETKFFPGQRGRGGEVVKVRVHLRQRKCKAASRKSNYQGQALAHDHLSFDVANLTAVRPRVIFPRIRYLLGLDRAPSAWNQGLQHNQTIGNRAHLFDPYRTEIATTFDAYVNYKCSPDSR